MGRLEIGLPIGKTLEAELGSFIHGEDQHVLRGQREAMAFVQGLPCLPSTWGGEHTLWRKRTSTGVATMRMYQKIIYQF